MIFIDIDGTLLTSAHTITPATKEVIQHIIHHLKIPIVLATARPPQGTFFIYNELALDTPLICFNGGLVLEKKANNEFDYIDDNQVAHHFLEEIHRYTDKQEIIFNTYHKTEWYVDAYSALVEREANNTKSKPIHTQTPNLLRQWKQEDKGAHKVLLMGEAEKLDDLEKKFNEIFDSALNISKSKPVYLEITHQSASKARAIQFIAKRFGVSQSEVIAIGDNYNDMEMIQWAGKGVAMGNAPKKVQEIADFVTYTNNEEGLKVALQKILNL
ncbi:MAG: Cof-type HAD-IIB family hydrolase [Thermoflexibacter sp.]|nr:Cof-type HAD-IIB family hydrolase [Thermoflexibacter sp.]